jgi:hypothetical protein
MFQELIDKVQVMKEQLKAEDWHLLHYLLE